MHTIHTVIHSKLTDDWPASETVLTGLQKKHAAGPLSPELMFTGVEDGGDYGVSSRPARRPGGGWLEASPSPRGWGGGAGRGLPRRGHACTLWRGVLLKAD